MHVPIIQTIGIIALYYFMIRFFMLKYIRELFEANRLKSTGTAATGVITNVTTGETSDAVKTYKPLIEFTAYNGSIYSFTPRDPMYKPPQIGERVRVLYDKNDPGISIQDDRRTWSHIWFKILLIAFLLILVTLGYLSQVKIL